jgi:hypothetical protein
MDLVVTKPVNLQALLRGIQEVMENGGLMLASLGGRGPGLGA